MPVIVAIAVHMCTNSFVEGPVQRFLWPCTSFTSFTSFTSPFTTTVATVVIVTVVVVVVAGNSLVEETHPPLSHQTIMLHICTEQRKIVWVRLVAVDMARAQL